MLVLSRKEQETIYIGADIKITVCRLEHGKVKLGIEAPDHVNIARGELEPEVAELTIRRSHVRDH